MRLSRLNPLRDRAGRPRSPLGREIALMLALKIALLYAIWSAFFSQPVLKKMTTGLDPARVAAVIVTPAAPAAPDAVPPAPTLPPPRP